MESGNVANNIPNPGYDYIYGPPPFRHNTFVLATLSINCVGNGFFSLFGLVTNVINVIVFYKQGILSHSCTVSLMALAISDLFYCFFNTLQVILEFMKYVPAQNQHSFDIVETTLYMGTRPRNLFIKVTCWITAFASFERAVSVISPFRVKSIFTPKRSLGVIVIMFVGIFGFHIPELFEQVPVLIITDTYNYLTYKRTYIPLRRTFVLFNAVISLALAVLIVALCNIIIFWKVIESHRFQKKHNVSSQPSKSDDDYTSSQKEETETNPEHSMTKTTRSNQEATKEKKLLRLITVVTSVFFFCCIQHVIYAFLFYIILLWGIDYHPWTESIVSDVLTIFQTLNSAVGIIIYTHMSSRYREELKKLVSLQRKEE